MDPISQMPFQDRIQIIFIVASTSLRSILPEYLSNFGGVSRRHLKTEEEFFPLNFVRSLEDSWF